MAEDFKSISIWNIRKRLNEYKEARAALENEADGIRTGIRRRAAGLLISMAVWREPAPADSKTMPYANDSGILVRLLTQSLATDPDFREAVRGNPGLMADEYWEEVRKAGRLPDARRGAYPSPAWARRLAEEAYWRNQVQTLPQRTRLLRGLRLPTGAPERSLMEFKVGQTIAM